MKVDPSEPLCRRRLQTAISCFGPKTAGVNVMVESVTSDHVMWGLERRMQMNLRRRIETPLRRHQNRNCLPGPGRARRTPTYWPCDVRCTGGVTLIWAFVRNLRTWSVMLRERVQVGTHEAESTEAPPGAYCFVVARKRGNSRGAKGAGYSRADGVNGQPEELLVLLEAAAFPGGASRMNREIHVRICERLGVQLPGPARRRRGDSPSSADS